MKAALLVEQGMKDVQVEPEESLQVIDDYKKRGVAIETLIFNDEGHAISKNENVVKSTVTMVEFFLKHLKG